ncbi:hypothetical protein Si107_00163 [Streptococcus infantarius subsp. infantarius]|nr:hypothetical protein [Streptococcus infantarius subsp. infantarius]
MKKTLIGSSTALTVLSGIVAAYEVKADAIISGNTYKITAKHSGKVLDVAPGAKTASANVPSGMTQTEPIKNGQLLTLETATIS